MTDHYRKLYWQCRRGTVELDILLRRYLQHAYPYADVAEQRLFERLLALSDKELLGYFFAGQRPADPDIAKLVERIRLLGDSGEP